MVALLYPAASRAARRAVKIALVLAVVGVEVALVAPHVSRGGSALADLRWGWVGAAIVAEAASVVTFGRLRQTLLRAGGAQVPPGRMGALAVATSAISATVPAGTAVAAGYLYRQLRRTGISAAVVAWTLSAAAVVSGLAFTVVTVAGAVLDGDDSAAGIAGAGGASVLTVVLLAALLTTVTRHPRPLVRIAHAVCARLPLRRSTACRAGSVEQTVADLTAITPRWRHWGAAFAFATLNWAADLACFVLSLYAVGADGIGLGMAVLAYVAGLATSSITLLPGGIGTVEAGMMVGLAHAGVAAPVAIAGILTYRLVAYALVGLVGWGVWAGLRRRRPPAEVAALA